MKKLSVGVLLVLVLLLAVLPCYGQGGRDYSARVLRVSRWIDLSGRIFNRVVMSFADGDTTPPVDNSNIFKTVNTSGTTITAFDNVVIGQQIAVLFGDANTTIDFSGTNLLGNGGVDWTANQGDVFTGVYDGTNWYCEVSNPSVISGDLTVTGGVTIGNGLVIPLTIITNADTPFSLLDGACLICDTTNSAITVNLPAASTVTGRIYWIKNSGAVAKNVTIDANGSELIDEVLTVTLIDKEAITIVSDGSNWHVM